MILTWLLFDFEHCKSEWLAWLYFEYSKIIQDMGWIKSRNKQKLDLNEVWLHLESYRTWKRNVKPYTY